MAGRSKTGMAILLFLAVIFLPSYCRAIEVSDFVDQFVAATDVQRSELVKKSAGEKVSVKGTIADVKEHDTFDERVDKGARYYKVILDPQKSVINNSYQVSVFYKTEAEVKNFTRGQEFAAEGSILKIIDEKLYISVWLYAGLIGPEEKAMFGEGSIVSQD